LVQVVANKIQEGGKAQLDDVQKLKELLSKCVQQISERIYQDSVRSDNLHAKVARVKRYVSSMGNGSSQGGDVAGLRTYTDSQLEVFRKAIGLLDKKMSEVISATHHDSVKFNGFGFRRIEEANAWLETHLLNNKFGLIVDVHTMVLEHLASASATTIPMLQQLVKIDMKDMSQGIAVSSFDHRLPRLLVDETGYTVISTDQSYFDKVKTYKEWEEPYTGYRD
jgi:hypothetical protein